MHFRHEHGFPSARPIAKAVAVALSFTYPTTHYVASHTEIDGVTRDEDVQDAAAWSAATSSSSPCTLGCAMANVSATVLTGCYVECAPGILESDATDGSTNFVPRFGPAASGFSADNPIVFFARNPASVYHDQLSLCTELKQLQGLTGRDPLGNIRTPEASHCFMASAGEDHIIFDGFYMRYDGSDTRTFGIVPREEEGVIGIYGSRYCEIRRVYVQCDDFNTDTGENKSWLFLNNARDCRIVDCKFEGNGTSQNHNSAAIQTRWADNCVIEHNYFDGINAIWNKGANWGPFLNNAYDDVPDADTHLDLMNSHIRPRAGDTIEDATTGATATLAFDAIRWPSGQGGGEWPSHAFCRAATTANLNATASGSGVGKTLTNAGTQQAISIDGVSLALNDRVLVKNQTTASDNGVYTVTTVGDGSTNWVLTRATDLDENAEWEGLWRQFCIYVEEGTTNTNTGWALTWTEAITVDTTDIVWRSVELGHGYMVIHTVSGTFGAGNDLEIGGTVVGQVDDGVLGNGAATYVDGAYNRARNCTIRYNYIINAVIYGCQDTDQESITYYQNFIHVDQGLGWAQTTPNENDWNQVRTNWDGYLYKFYNNTIIAATGSGFNTGYGGDGGLTPIDSASECHSNIVVDDGALEIYGYESYPPTNGRMDSWNIYDRNVYYARSGSIFFDLDRDHSSDHQYTGLTAWKAYCDDFGLQPGQPTELYEENTVDTDPQFVSANWSSPELGDWRLANNGQDARTIGLSAVNNGVCGCYITGAEEIGLRANPTY